MTTETYNGMMFTLETEEMREMFKRVKLQGELIELLKKQLALKLELERRKQEERWREEEERI